MINALRPCVANNIASSSRLLLPTARLIPPFSATAFSSLATRSQLSLAQTSRMFATSARNPEQPKTYSLQNTLPRLPVPDLEKSLEAYLKSLIPVIEQRYGASHVKKELEKRRLFIRDFTAPGGLGLTLQQRLLDLDHASPNNWLNDTLWLNLAYHTWRAPLLVNSNWWLIFSSDPSDPQPPIYTDPELDSKKTAGAVRVPDPDPDSVLGEGSQGGGKEWLAQNREKPSKGIDWEKIVKRDWVTEWQIMKASWMVRRFAEFRTKLAREEVAPDASKAGPFDMEQYKHLYNFSRIPAYECDAFSRPAPQARHITLMIDDFIYSVDVFEEAKSIGDFPEPLAVKEIQRRIRDAVDDCRKRLEKGEKGDAVGILTADQRDTWTKNRERILLQSPQNIQTSNSIATSLLALSLDTYTLPSVSSSDPLFLPTIDSQVRNSASGINGASNRWFDKAISVLVETNGRAGIMGEHSPVDALIPSIAVEYVLAEDVDESQFMSSKSDSSTKGKGVVSGEAEKGWDRLDWVIDESTKEEIELCRSRNKEIIEDSDASQLWWGEYGVDWIKKRARISPDAYLQQALQLAWFRDQGYATATYETASTRSMLHGRTDVIRTLSEESRAFVKSMMNDSTDSATKYQLLQKAAEAHTKLTRTSSSGHGFDRHLMGLKTRLRPGETHALFEDEMYAKSQEWKLSTSGLSHGGKFHGTGFGAAWPDGYGINYLAGNYLLKFGIESKFSSPTTSTAHFKHQIVQALRDMRAVCEAEAGKEQVKDEAGQVKAKL